MFNVFFEHIYFKLSFFNIPLFCINVTCNKVRHTVKKQFVDQLVYWDGISSRLWGEMPYFARLNFIAMKYFQRNTVIREEWRKENQKIKRNKKKCI